MQPVAPRSMSTVANLQASQLQPLTPEQSRRTKPARSAQYPVFPKEPIRFLEQNSRPRLRECAADIPRTPELATVFVRPQVPPKAVSPHACPLRDGTTMTLQN